MPRTTVDRDRRLVTQRVDADHIGVTDRTIRNMIRRGDISGFRIGTRMMRVDLNELDRLVDRGRVPSGGRG